MIINEARTYWVRIRHRQMRQKAILTMKKTNLYISFEQAQRGIAKGQFAAWYRKDELIGSGEII